MTMKLQLFFSIGDFYILIDIKIEILIRLIWFRNKIVGTK